MKNKNRKYILLVVVLIITFVNFFTDYATFLLPKENPNSFYTIFKNMHPVDSLLSLTIFYPFVVTILLNWKSKLYMSSSRIIVLILQGLIGMLITGVILIMMWFTLLNPIEQYHFAFYSNIGLPLLISILSFCLISKRFSNAFFGIK